MPYSISISRSIYLDIDVDLIINIDIPLKPYSIPISISNNLDIVKYLVKIKNLDIVKILSRWCQYQDILPTSVGAEETGHLKLLPDGLDHLGEV